MLVFFRILFTEFIAEMGDKTQLMLVAMTSKYKIRDIVLGTAAAVLVLNGLAVLAGGLVGSLVPEWLIKLIAALAFMFFAVTSLDFDDEEEEEETGDGSRIKVASIAVFCTFFVAELGDKTQLTAITFGANEGLKNAVIVWLACSIGLFAADIIGMLVGCFLKNKMPEKFLKILAFVIFSVFGVLTMHTSLGLATFVDSSYVIPVTALVTVVFAVICVLYYANQKNKQ